MQDSIKQIDMEFMDMTSELGSLEGQYKLLSEQIKESKELVTKYEKDIILSTKAVELLDMVQTITKDYTCNKFETLVTQMLQFIFESDEYEFKLEFGRRGNLQELKFYIKKPNIEEIFDPMDVSGGGVLNIISVALRIVLIEISTPRIHGPMIFDESFSNLSEEYLPNAARFLKDLTKKLNRQIILITHKDHFKEEAERLIEIK